MIQKYYHHWLLPVMKHVSEASSEERVPYIIVESVYSGQLTT